jgi:cysteinyl-tRNA synthetase
MELQLHNTANRKKETFKPIDPNNVRIYGCGPTVYDYAHIGNGRSFVTFDLLFRVLRHIYGETHVTFVRNITDIDDKIMAKAAERGAEIRDVTEETVKAFNEDMATLGLLIPSHQPRATDYLPGMIEMIGTLVDQGYAYLAEGHVLFEVKKDARYGTLSGRSTDDMIAGARVEVAPYKKYPMDFVLWKPSQDDQPGWESPWGRGRPGWHLECSVMSEAFLGETFDIHAGGVDLIFPHHENEVAQSTCAHGGAPMANYWVHGGFLQVEGEKMSKSLGNFKTVHDLVRQWPGEAMRLHIITSHYRQGMNFATEGLKEAKGILDRWYRLVADVEEPGRADDAFLNCLLDDLNVPGGLAELHRLASESGKGDKNASATLKASANLLGLLQLSTQEWEGWRPEGLDLDEAQIEVLIAGRNAARTAKDFAEADRLRDELAAMGVAIKDGPEGTTWELA